MRSQEYVSTDCKKGKPVRPKAGRVSKLSSWTALLVVHAAHAGHTAWTSRRFFFFRQFCHQSFSHQQQPGNRSPILQRGPSDFGRFDNTTRHTANVFILPHFVPNLTPTTLPSLPAQLV